ncbi:MAG: hypothetical protein NWF12_01425 [Candidatus Bathyarchaeota archaeon]|nr:hypothetical protein [Candidatus Bathyarchaeota archaeon]
MPFTPYHVGPALLIGFLFYPFLDVPTFVIANVVIDVEPLLVILLDLPQPLHGPFHSLTLSTPVALLLAVLVHGFRRFTRPIVVARMLPQNPGFRDILKTSVIGVWIHVLLDALLYPEMRLFYPIAGNPLLGLVPSQTVTTFCVASFLLSLPVYLVRVYLVGRRRGVPDSEFEAEFEEPEIAYPVGVMGGEFGGDDVEIVVEEPISHAGDLGEPKIFIGCDRVPKQWGVIGRSGGSLVAADLNEPHIIFVCGKQGSGKGYTIGVFCEMLLSKSIPGISRVSKPATVVVFHKPREDMRSEFWSIVEENRVGNEAEALRGGYGLEPRRVITSRKLRVFTDPFVYENERAKFEEDYQSRVCPIGIDPGRLTAQDWPHVLSIGRRSGSLYVKKIFQIVKRQHYSRDFGLESIRQEIDRSDLNPTQKGFAFMRLETLQDYLEAGDFVDDLVFGGVNVFDLRKIMMEPDDVFSVMILVISAILNSEGFESEQFVFVINEAHDYLRKGLSKDFTDYVTYLIRKKRHAGTWLMLDTHFPEDVDPKVIMGSDVKVFHKSDILSSSILRRIVDGTEVPPHMLGTGQAIIRSDKSVAGPDRLLLVDVRPRLTQHGAPTKTAI